MYAKIKKVIIHEYTCSHYPIILLSSNSADEGRDSVGCIKYGFDTSSEPEIKVCWIIYM